MKQEIKYIEDVLSHGFEQTTINQPNDYEGKVITTVIRKRTTIPSTKAVLYVHGFNDYFFQEEMAAEFIQKGFHFYAVDLRKYGRSILPNQRQNNTRNLAEYYTDLDDALLLMKQEGNEKILLYGHSTGGLIASLYAAERIEYELFDAVFCNSPFYDMNLPEIQKKTLIPIVALLGKIIPNLPIPVGFSALYGESLHQNDHGEWDYNLNWKPHLIGTLNAGWIAAIHKGHLKIRAGITVGVPILILHSEQSLYPKQWSESLFEGDAILNVTAIAHKASLIQAPKKEILAIRGAIHDLVLSKKAVRKTVFETLFGWLNANF
ncbi:alpha/beta hydrolase [Flavobacterium restrictum]|uniref:Alpha/beta hydrolase n=1 Tax=Flavobacterium restrictum TaxID=2594428 RepID=A0A553E410_9FLAO|nr:alpha/beta hydrolase [Flavobacterium restrictum]TRX39735.1 alpha/beta hydrolase [Flavobacterium restrictum]